MPHSLRSVWTASETRNTQGLTGNVGYSRNARNLKITKLSCVVQEIHLVLQVLNLNQRLTLSFSAALRVYQFSTVELHPFLHSVLFTTQQFLGNLLRDLPEKLCFSCVIVQITLFSLSLITQLIPLTEFHSLGFKQVG